MPEMGFVSRNSINLDPEEIAREHDEQVKSMTEEQKAYLKGFQSHKFADGESKEESLLAFLSLYGDTKDEKLKKEMEHDILGLFGESSKNLTPDQKESRTRLASLVESLGKLSEQEYLIQGSLVDGGDFETAKKFTTSKEAGLAKGFNILSGFFQERDLSLETMLHLPQENRRYLSYCASNPNVSLPDFNDRVLSGAIKTVIDQKPEEFYARMNDCIRDANQLLGLTHVTELSDQVKGRSYHTNIFTAALDEPIQTGIMDKLNAEKDKTTEFGKRFLSSCGNLGSFLLDENKELKLQGPDAFRELMGKNPEFLQNMDEFLYNSRHGHKNMTGLDEKILPSVQKLEKAFQSIPGYQNYLYEEIEKPRQMKLMSELFENAEGKKASAEFKSMEGALRDLRTHREEIRDGKVPERAESLKLLWDAVEKSDAYIKERDTSSGKKYTTDGQTRLDKAKELSTLLKNDPEFALAKMDHEISQMSATKRGWGRKNSEEFEAMDKAVTALQKNQFRAGTEEEKIALYEAWKACEDYIQKKDTNSGLKRTDAGQIRLDNAKAIRERLEEMEEFEECRRTAEEKLDQVHAKTQATDLKQADDARKQAEEAKRREEEAKQRAAEEKRSAEAKSLKDAKENIKENGKEKEKGKAKEAPSRNRLTFGDLKKGEEGLGQARPRSKSVHEPAKVKKEPQKEERNRGR